MDAEAFQPGSKGFDGEVPYAFVFHYIHLSVFIAIVFIDYKDIRKRHIGLCLMECPLMFS